MVSRDYLADRNKIVAVIGIPTVIAWDCQPVNVTDTLDDLAFTVNLIANDLDLGIQRKMIHHQTTPFLCYLQERD
jgi:hypothetical protein